MKLVTVDEKTRAKIDALTKRHVSILADLILDRKEFPNDIWKDSAIKRESLTINEWEVILTKLDAGKKLNKFQCLQVERIDSIIKWESSFDRFRQ
jgi:hypothetical protein